jgi:beta-lactamase superfamily II metal-dependent hydrolase
MTWCVHGMAQLPFSSTAVRPPPLWLVLILFSAAILWAMRHRLKFSRATAAVSMLAALSIAALWYALTSAPQTQITALSVGRGSTLVLETASGKVVLIDAGATRAHVTSRVIDPYLRSRGINNIDAMLLTHVDDAHISGAMDVIDLYRPRQIYMSASDLKRGPWNYFANVFLERFRHRRIAPSPLAAGTTIQIDDRNACDVLWPPDLPLGALPNSQTGAILLLKMEEKQILVIGSKNDASLQMVLDTKPDLKFDAAIITAGDPSPAMVTRIRNHGAKIFLANIADPIDDSYASPRFAGAITLTSSGGAIKAKSALGRD